MDGSHTQTPNEAKRGLTSEGWMTDCWYFLASSKTLKKGKQSRIMVLGQPIVAGRDKAGEPFALRDICPHRLVPLSAGKQIDHNDEPTLQCPYHGWQFGTRDGVCKLMPSLTGDEPIDCERVKIWKYPIHEANGAIYVYVAHERRGTPDIAMPPPNFGPLPDKPKLVVEKVFNAHMDDAVGGLIDPAHVPYVHNQWWWRPPSIGHKVKTKVFEPIDRGWLMVSHKPSANSRLYKWFFGENITTEIFFQMPGYRWEVISGEKMRFTTLTTLTPMDEKRTYLAQYIWWTGAPLLNLILPIARPATSMFLDQDGHYVDLQNQGMKYHKNMLWIDDIDKQAKWYFTAKREWANARTEGRAFVNPVTPTTLKWRS